MAGDTDDSNRDQVNQWLSALTASTSGGGDLLNEAGVALITREDGAQIVLRLNGELLGFYHALFEVPETNRGNYLQTALMFNLHADVVGSGHLAYDDNANTLAYCAQMPMAFMDEEVFLMVVGNVFTFAENLRDQFFTLAGIPPELVDEPAAVPA